MARTTIASHCPACPAETLEYNAETVDLPYLGESLETMLRCNECGYRHTDFILTASKDPTRHSFVIDTEEDMSARVVRSSSGTIRIPELGILVEPGVASDAFISNVEGILVRVERILAQLLNDADTEEMRQRIRALQQRMLDMRDGKAPAATLILEDPFGNSAILHDKAVSELIPAEDAAKLKVGMFVHDLNEGEEE